MRTHPCPRPSQLSGGPDHLRGRVAHGEVERRMAGSLSERCHLLWMALYGSDCDFDDCHVALAEKLGWEPSPEADLSTILGEVFDTIENSRLSWLKLRSLAVSVFEECRGDCAVEADSYDGRTWDQAVDDVLFRDGDCRLCGLGVPGTKKEHRDVAGWILHGQTSWARIEAVLRAQRS